MGRYTEKQTPDRKKSRWWAINRLVSQYGGKCYLCHESFKSKKEITLDHLIARSKGGQDAIENMRLAHERCNKEKKNMSLEEYAVLQEGF